MVASRWSGLSSDRSVVGRHGDVIPSDRREQHRYWLYPCTLSNTISQPSQAACSLISRSEISSLKRVRIGPPIAIRST